MNPEEALEQATFEALTHYGLPDSKALKIARATVEAARRTKHRGPISRPGVLIDDRIKVDNSLTITIRKKYADKIEPREVLTDYLEKHKISGSWDLREITNIHPAKKILVFRARPAAPDTKVPSVRGRKPEKEILKEFATLSPERQAEIIKSLQS